MQNMSIFSPEFSWRVRASARAVTLTLALLCFALPGTLCAAQAGEMERAFWARSWQAMDAIYERAASADIVSGSASPALSARDLSLYVNGLWRQGQYARGISILESVQQDFPAALQPYAKMLLVLGAERTDRKESAFQTGTDLWETAPAPLRYYLAYALGRLSRDLSKPDASIEWFRKMLELAPDKKRRLQALTQMIALPGVTATEAAQLLIDLPSNARALEICRAQPKGANGRVEYALGYHAYVGRKYQTAAGHFELASADVTYGEAARYYQGYAAYREGKNDTAYSLWSGVALSGYDYPQRSVQRLTALAERTRKRDVIELFQRVARDRETDYPELAADALVGIIRLGEGDDVASAEEALFRQHAASNQSATVRWERGWRAWKQGRYQEAYDQWSNGYAPGIPSSELAARLLYWQMRALEALKSPEATNRVKMELVDGYPAEYYTFLVSPDGGIRNAPVPSSYDVATPLEDWGFVTYARLEGMDSPSGKPDVPALYRAARLALWEGDFASAVRAFGVLQRTIPAAELACSELLKLSYPRAFETEVLAASSQTGLDPAIIWGVMRQESLYEPDVTSTAGAFGLMQLMPATARGEAQKMKLAPDAYKQVPGNVLLGANHLVGLFARFKDAPRSLAAYNAGGTPVTRWSKEPIADMAAWVEDIGYRETRGYVKAVLRNIEVYRNLYGK